MNGIQKKHRDSCDKSYEYYGSVVNDYAKISSSLETIRAGKVAIDGCASSIAAFYKYNGMLHWFKYGDLDKARHNFYIAAKSEIISAVISNKPHFECSHKLYALLSDNEEIFNWYSQDVGALYDSFGKGAQRNKINSFDYYKFNYFLAIQGYWDLLAERSKYILENPPIKKYQAELTHHVFYLALSKGDVAGMKAAIDDIISPAKLHKQNMSGCPIPRFFISYWGTLFAKMAWRYGYELEFDNPLIPQEWLPIKPLIHYEDPHDFLKRDIYLSYEGEFEKYSPQRDKANWINLTEGSWPPI